LPGELWPEELLDGSGGDTGGISSGSSGAQARWRRLQHRYVGSRQSSWLGGGLALDVKGSSTRRGARAIFGPRAATPTSGGRCTAAGG
jgi:hypothetical protein